MSYLEYQERFATDGRVIVPRFLDASALGELSANLVRYLRDVVPGLPPTHAFYVDRRRPDTLKQLQRMSLDPFFEAYRSHPLWLSLAGDLLGEKACAHEPEWFDKPPGEPAPTPPHQDNYYFNLVPPSVLTIWVALDPVDEENGCVRFLPGSHREGVRPHGASSVLGFSQGITDYGPVDYAREVSVHLQPGDASVHHGLTVHRADPNRSTSRHRRAFAMVFHGVSSSRDEEAYQRYLSALKRQHSALHSEPP